MIKITPVRLDHRAIYTFEQLFDHRLCLSGKFLRPLNLNDPKCEFDLVCMVDRNYQTMLVFAHNQICNAPVTFTRVNCGLWDTRVFEVIERPITITLSNEPATVD